MSEQQAMEAFFEETVRNNLTEQAERINGLIKPSFVSCSAEEKSSLMAYPVQKWQGNRYEVMQGGMIVSCMDNAMAMLAIYLSPTGATTTLSLEAKFLRPIRQGDTLEVATRAVMDGSKVDHFYGEARSRQTGKLIATATSVFMKLDQPPEEV